MSKDYEMYNLVFVKHGESKPYLFKLPLDVTIEEGEEVFVDTTWGHNTGKAYTDSFKCSDFQTYQIAKAVGAYFPLKNVTGKSQMQAVEVKFCNALPF